MLRMLDQPRPLASTATIEIGLGNGNPLVLSALSHVLDRAPRFSLVFTSKTAEGFLEAHRRVPVKIGIVEWSLPSLGGEALVAALRQQPSVPRILVYGSGDSATTARAAMAAGAAGFCSNETPPEKLLETALAIASGQMVFPFVDVRELNRDPTLALTERERSLLNALARGHSNKELADILGISVNTVKFHLRNLYGKLGVASRAQALAFYFSNRAGPSENG
jgi:two-component system nitrate/nitrite response regulator NarP